MIVHDDDDDNDFGVAGSEKGEEAVETAVAVDESGSNLVVELPPRSSSERVLFTNLSQIDADLALARTLQEQERAYMMLSMNSEVSDYGIWETGSYVYEEDEDEDEDEYETDDDPEGDVPDVYAQEDEGENADAEEAGFSDDEAFARALQEAQERDIVDRFSALSGLANRVEDPEDGDDDNASQVGSLHYNKTIVRFSALNLLLVETMNLGAPLCEKNYSPTPFLFSHVVAKVLSFCYPSVMALAYFVFVTVLVWC